MKSTYVLSVLCLISMLLGCRTQEALVIPPEPTPLPPVTAIIDPPTPTPVTEAPAAAPTATLTTVTETSVTNLADYAQSLETAINQRDVDPLGQMMSQPFYIGGWRSEWRQYDRDAALTELQHHYPPAEAAIQFSPLDTDLSLMLDGQPVQMMLGPDLNVVSAIHSTGWGSDGQNEAILFIVETRGDEWVWNGFLYNAFGPFVQTEDQFVTLPTDVGYVVIMANEATFYSGPGLSYEPVATVFGGFNYPVIGISEDGAWWRLTCYDDNNAPISACWVSTDPTITAPTAPPPGG